MEDSRTLRIYIALGGVAFLLVMGAVLILLYNPLAEELDPIHGLCGSATLERECYNTSRDTCFAVWNSFADDCKEEVRGRLNPNQATALIGPMVQWCIQKRYDKTVHSTRKLTPSGRCSTHFQKLDAPVY